MGNLEWVSERDVERPGREVLYLSRGRGKEGEGVVCRDQVGVHLIRGKGEERERGVRPMETSMSVCIRQESPKRKGRDCET